MWLLGWAELGVKCARSKFVDVFLVWGWPSAHRTAGIITSKLCCVLNLQISNKAMQCGILVYCNTVWLFYILFCSLWQLNLLSLTQKSICLTSYFSIPDTGQLPKEVAQISFQSGLIVQIIEGPRLQSHTDNFIITGRGPESGATKYQQMAAENTAIHVF